MAGEAPKMSLSNVVQRESFTYPDGATDGTFPKDSGLLNLRNGLKIMSVRGAVERSGRVLLISGV